LVRTPVPDATSAADVSPRTPAIQFDRVVVHRVSRRKGTRAFGDRT